MRVLAKVLCVYSSLLLAGCASNGFYMAKPKVTMFGEKYPAKSESENIDVYMSSQPTKEFSEISKISCGDTSDKWNMEQIKKKAKEIGADGIIILGKSGSYGVGIPTETTAIIVTEEYGISAIAIRYKK